MVIQDRKLEPWNTNYARARSDLPGGGSVLPPWPAGVLPVVEARCDTWVDQHTGSRNVHQVLQSRHAMTADWLRVLAHPDMRRHNNATESDSCACVKRRKISGGTRSAAGRRC